MSNSPRIVWTRPLAARGLGGVAATANHVLVSDRELDDTSDLFLCLRADNGEEVWRVSYPAIGNLDYGNSPRATPLVTHDRVYLLGALGNLHCVDLATGNIQWQVALAAEFELDPPPTWGACGSPLLVEGKLIVNPGAPDASIVALDAATGEVIWKTPGSPAGYGSLMVATLGGKKQIVGHDSDSLGGWEIATGRRLWRLPPPHPKDFNVPTPVVVGERLIVSTENNGTRMFQFRSNGTIDPEPVAWYEDLVPDTQTPVVAGGRLFGVSHGLHCLDVQQNLKPLWTSEEPEFSSHASIVASDTRLLITTLEGELLLIDAQADRYRLLGRQKVFDSDRGVYSHPAIVGKRLFVRGSDALVCLDLTEPDTSK